jgi:hypothetical protein
MPQIFRTGVVWAVMMWTATLFSQELHLHSTYKFTLSSGNFIEGSLLSKQGQWVKVLQNDQIYQINLHFISKIEGIESFPIAERRYQGQEDQAFELTLASWNAEWLFLHESRREQINQDRPGSFDDQEPARSNRPLDLIEEEWKFSSVCALLANPAPQINIPQAIALQEVGSYTAAKEVAHRLTSITGIPYIAFSRGKLGYAPGHDSSIIIRESLQATEVFFEDEIEALAETNSELKSFIYYKGSLSQNAFPRMCIVDFWFNYQKIRFLSLHLTSGNAQHNLLQSNVLRIWLNHLIQNLKMSVILAGDFNNFSDRPTMSIIRDQPGDSLVDALYIAREVNGKTAIDPYRIGPLTTNQYSPEPIDHVLMSKDLYEDDFEQENDLSIERAWIVRDGVIVNGVDPKNRRRYRQELLIFKERDLSDHYPLFVRFVVR